MMKDEDKVYKTKDKGKNKSWCRVEVVGKVQKRMMNVLKNNTINQSFIIQFSVFNFQQNIKIIFASFEGKPE